MFDTTRHAQNLIHRPCIIDTTEQPFLPTLTRSPLYVKYHRTASPAVDCSEDCAPHGTDRDDTMLSQTGAITGLKEWYGGKGKRIEEKERK